MIIPCPFCGPRDRAEFTCRGEVSAELYGRRNPAGPTREHWYHSGCGRWLEVGRNTVTHEVTGARFAGRPA